MTNTHFIVVPQDSKFSSRFTRTWAIFNRLTNKVEEGGFSTRTAAVDYMEREYLAPQEA